MGGLSDFEWVQASLATARHHGMDMDEFCRLASQASTAKQLDCMVDEYVAEVPVEAAPDSYSDLDRPQDFIGPISWPIMLAQVSFNGFM